MSYHSEKTKPKHLEHIAYCTKNDWKNTWYMGTFDETKNAIRTLVNDYFTYVDWSAVDLWTSDDVKEKKKPMEYDMKMAVCQFIDANGLKRIYATPQEMLDNLDKMLIGLAQEREYWLKQRDAACPTCGKPK